MLRGAIGWLHRRLGPRYLRVALTLTLGVGHLVVIGGVFLILPFVAEGDGDFWRILAFAQVAVLVENLLALRWIDRHLEPAAAWLHGDHTADAAVRAWRAVASMPLEYLRRRRGLPTALNVLPVAAYATLTLEQPWWPSFPLLALGAGVVFLYGFLLRLLFFEVVSAPVLSEISQDVPRAADLGQPTVPLRWRLLLTVPAINVVTGVVVSAFAAPDNDLATLGVGVGVSILVAFTISLELSLLLTRSVVGPLDALREGAERVGEGDFGVRVPVVGSDELGQLTIAFNDMVDGLQEREKLREAFGAYVDPHVVERVVSEGALLEGEETDVTIVFIDIRDFTAFAERSSAAEVVAQLNRFYEVVVPILVRHGGHANKFVGDGLLGVFGTPDVLADHADRAVAAALDVLEEVDRHFGGTLRIGIGINSGSVIAGSIGGGGRIDFTVIGDAVNTASRVEAATRTTGDELLITAATHALLRDGDVRWEPRGAVELRGKTTQVLLYAPSRDGDQGQEPTTGSWALPVIE